MMGEEAIEYGYPGPQSLGGSPVSMHIWSDDVDAAVARAVAAGAKLTQPVKDQFYGVRSGSVLDPFGYIWNISTNKKEMTLDEVQTARPADLPSERNPLTLTANGSTFQVIEISALPVNDVLDLRMRYRAPSISDTSKTFADNMAIMKALVQKYPEYREAFNAVVARAVDPSGQDYGSVMEMAKLK